MEHFLAKEYFLSAINESFKKIHGKYMPKKMASKISKHFDITISHKRCYSSYSITNSKVNYLIIAYTENCPFEGDIITCWNFDVLKEEKSKPLILDQISKIRKFLNAPKRNIKVVCPVHEEIILKNLLKSGFQINGQKLKGKTQDGLNFIQKKNLTLNDGFKFKIPKKSEIKKLMNIEKDVHAHEPTSVVNYTKKSIAMMSKYMGKMIETKSLFAVYDEFDKPIAHIGLLFYDGIAHIGTISISRAYQGQGLAYILYEKALRDLKRRKIRIYTGYSATKKVLKMAKNLKRTPVDYNLTYKR